MEHTWVVEVSDIDKLAVTLNFLKEANCDYLIKKKYLFNLF